MFKSILGFTLLITSMGGEATGKAGKQIASSFGEYSHQANKKINSYQSDFAKYATNVLEATESFAKNGQNIFESLEKKSKKLGNYANNLLRDEEYRSLKPSSDNSDPKFSGGSGAGSNGDWTLINPSSQEKQEILETEIQEALNTDINKNFKLLPQKASIILPKENKLKSLGSKFSKIINPKKNLQEKPVKNSFFNSFFKKSFLR